MAGMPDRNLFCFPRLKRADGDRLARNVLDYAAAGSAGILNKRNRVQIHHTGGQLAEFSRSRRIIFIFAFALDRVVEKGNLYNLKSEYSDQPLIDSCFIRNSAGDGIQIYRSDLSVSHTVIENNAGNGINLTSNYTSSPKIIGSTVQNNTLHGFCMYPCNSPVIQNVTVSGNHLSNEIAVLAGDMNYSTRWNYAGCGYDIYGDVSIFNSPAVRLTIAAGSTI